MNTTLKTSQNQLLRATTLITAMSLAPVASAGMITGVTWFSGVASVAGTVVNVPPAPNNDDVAGDSPNTFFVLQKDYTAIGPVDLVFDVIDSGGTTEYRFEEGIFNNTGIDWTGYHMELGFGQGAGFVKSTAGDGLDFDAPDYNSTVDFNPGGFFFSTVTATTEDDLVASGGTQPDFAYAGNYILHVDVPDGITSFTLRQSPIANPVPVPAAAWLFGSAIGLVAGIRQRQKAQR